MNAPRAVWIWTALVVSFVVVLWLLKPVLMPFLVGLAVAYLLDPVVDRLARRGMGRGAATALVLGAFFVVIAALLAILLPILQVQLLGAARALIQAGFRLYEQVRPHLAETIGLRIAAAPLDAASDIARRALGSLSTIASGLWSGGVALINLLALVFVTPVVAFYLLRDWDRIVLAIDSWLPRPHAQAIREVLSRIDQTMSGFLRGQAIVCLLLGGFYAVGLTLVGLEYGLLVGLATGIASIVPFVGMTAGMMAGLAIAIFQFPGWGPVAAVLGVFIAGQVIEGNWLTPRLVGERVGLHPVWVMLAVMGGGAVFGFVGVLVAVPAAAALGVLVRFALARYLASPLYLGGADER